MNLLSKNEFKCKKQSGTLVIYGSGASINNIVPSQWRKLSEHDSLSFNWFCKNTKVEPTFFLIREQANIPKRVTKTETVKDLFRCINKPNYVSTCFVVHDLRAHSPHAHCYVDDLDQIPSSGIIVADTQKGNLKQDIFDVGVYHGLTTLTNALHIAGYLSYSKIIFAGIDLNDSRYFWLKDGEVRDSIKQKGGSEKDPHPVAKAAIEAISQFQETYPSVQLTCLNPKSLLRKVMQHEIV